MQRGILGTSPDAWPAGTTIFNSSISVGSTYGFNPNGGTINISAPGASNTVLSNVPYAGVSGNLIYGITSGQFVGSTATAPWSVEYSTPDTAAPLAHWGSSVIMDGQFNDDKSLVFNYGTTTPVSIAAGATAPLLAIRVAPSADNNTIGLLGVKETINRMQLQLTDMAVVASGAVLVNLILNGVTTGFTGTFGPVAIGNNVTSSLAQVAVNTSGTATISGGESVTALYATGVNTIDLSTSNGAQSALTVLDKAIDTVTNSRAAMGAYQNRLTASISNLETTSMNLQASRSRILDTDYAKETTHLAKSQIITQAATAMLAQANQSAQSVLALLK